MRPEFRILWCMIIRMCYTHNADARAPWAQRKNFFDGAKVRASKEEFSFGYQPAAPTISPIIHPSLERPKVADIAESHIAFWNPKGEKRERGPPRSQEMLSSQKVIPLSAVRTPSFFSGHISHLKNIPLPSDQSIFPPAMGTNDKGRSKLLLA